MFKKRFIPLLLFVLLMQFATENTQAQLLKKKTTFTRADTLRGTISSVRSWFDVTYYDLNITVDPDEQSIAGYNDIYFRVNKPNSIMQLDLFENLKVDKIVFNGKELAFTREFNAVFIDFDEAVNSKEIQQLRFYYSGKPTVAKNPPWDGGFTWTQDKENNPWVSVSCQGIGASIWWPTKDHQSDEPDSMRVVCSAPSKLDCIGNGQFRGKTPDADRKGYDRSEWFVANPINNYGVSISLGKYTHFGETFKSELKPFKLNYYVLKYNEEKARKHFEQVVPMLECYESYLGAFPFPEDGFALVETPFLGMEHQSGIAYGNNYKTGYAGTDYSYIGMDFDYIIIHEAGHEWWGNSLTTADIADMWIHEGFTTYTEALYVECLYGYDKSMDYINAKKRVIANDRPMVGPYGVNHEGSQDMYNKGMLMLNTLRHVVDNDEVWFGIIKGLASDYRHNSTLTTDMIIAYMEEKSGKKLRKIFEQYLHHPKPPVLQYSIKKKGKNTEVSFKWRADVESFDLPIRYFDKKGDLQPLLPVSNEWRSLEVKKMKPERFEFDERSFYYFFDEVD